jgi:hypothetical protein
LVAGPLPSRVIDVGPTNGSKDPCLLVVSNQPKGLSKDTHIYSWMVRLLVPKDTLLLLGLSLL